MIRKLGKIGYYTFLGFLGVIAFAVAASVLPITGNYKILVVQSGSMDPAIKTGSVVVVKPFAAYQIGDVITFQGSFRGPKGERIPITHRIVAMKVERGDPVYVTQGDANNAPDPREVRHDEILGALLFTVPYVGYVVEVARKPYGFVALIIIPALIIFYDQGMKVWREVRRMKTQREVDTDSEHSKDHETKT